MLGDYRLPRSVVVFAEEQHDPLGVGSLLEVIGVGVVDRPGGIRDEHSHTVVLADRAVDCLLSVVREDESPFDGSPASAQ